MRSYFFHERVWLWVMALLLLVTVWSVGRVSAQGVTLTGDGAQTRGAQTRGELPGAVVTQDAIYVSFTLPGNIGGISYNYEDIMAYDRAVGVWYLFFDGSDVGLTANVDAFTLHPDGYGLLSLRNDGITVPGVAGTVDNSDILRFTPQTWGNLTAGSFSLEFDGSDVGLDATLGRENVDAIWADDAGNLYISTLGPVAVPGVSAGGEDMLRFTPTSLGSNTAGTWQLYFDGSDIGLGGSTENLNEFWLNPATDSLHFVTDGAFDVDGVQGSAVDIARCTLTATGANTACEMATDLYFEGASLGLGGRAIDALFIAPAADRSEVMFASVPKGLTLSGLRFTKQDVFGYDRDMRVWFMLFDGSDLNLNATYNLDTFALLGDGSFLLGFDRDNMTLPGIASIVDDSDLVRFIPTALGVNTAGTLTPYFDGSDVGLDTVGENVVGAYVGTDGALYLTMRNRVGVPGGDISWGRDDIVRFQPTMFVPETMGSWTLFFDGSDVGLASTNTEWLTGIWQHPTTGAIYLTKIGAFSLTGISGNRGDVFVCEPTSLGANTACNFRNTLFFSGVQVGIPDTYHLDALAMSVPAVQPAPDFSGRVADAAADVALDDHLADPALSDPDRVPTAVQVQRLDAQAAGWTPALALFALLLALSLPALRRARRA